MKFWDDGQIDSTRIRNVKFTWEKLKNLSNFLINNNINCDISLYDFSTTKIIDDAIHIPYPLGEYKKAEKTNIILNHKKDYDFFMMMDCDVFFDVDDYEKILDIFINLNIGDIVLFDAAKLYENISDYIINNQFFKENADWVYAYSGPKHLGPLYNHPGGLGGAYICDTSLLLNCGGFDEKFKGWGGEDGDAFGRILSVNQYYNIKSIRNFAPFHLPHFSDWGSIKYNKRFDD